MRHSLAEDRQRARSAKSARADRRVERMHQRLAAAQTPEAQLSIAYDWFRIATGRLAASRCGRDGSRPNRPEAERIMREMAGRLAQEAASIEGEGDRA